MKAGHTTWRIIALPSNPGERLAVRLTVDTTAPTVVHAIEAAARRAGVELEPEPEPEPEPGRQPLLDADPWPRDDRPRRGGLQR